MRLHLASFAQTPRAIPEALCPLIEALGTPEFQHQLFRSVERMIGAGAAAVYASADARWRPVLGDWQAGRGRLERHTREFAGRYASDDPAYRAFGLVGGSTCLTTCVAREELPHPGHRMLMEEAGFVSRVVSVFPGFSLHVLRSREHGELSDPVFEGFAQAAPVFGSLISRHLRWSSLETRLAALCPGLTPREAAVCSGLLRGLSSRDIAARLGIGLASVQTYRKRAYRKLGVGGLPALFHLLLNGEHFG
ncbi:MAG: helix-turn-helix transcriptional regulator [Burkholderiales bacterium]